MTNKKLGSLLEKIRILLKPPKEEEEETEEEQTPIILSMIDESVRCIDTYTIEDKYQVCISEQGEYLVNDYKVHPSEEAVVKRFIEGILRSGVDTKTYLSRIPSKYRYIIDREIRGFSFIQPLIDDKMINNIHIHAGKPIQVVHMKHDRLIYPVIPSLDRVEQIQLRLAEESGILVSARKPLMSFIDIKTMSRISGIFPSDITLRRSAYLDIRKQPPEPWNVFKLMELETLHPSSAAVLWLAILFKLGILVVGEMYTGKTTLINSLMSFMPPASRVMTIEDAPELRVPKTSYWIQTMPRLTVEDVESKISAFDILKTAVRMSIDYVIVGEIRGEEARHWAQAIMIGHGGLCLPRGEPVLAMINGVVDLYPIERIVEAVGLSKRVYLLGRDGEWKRAKRAIIKHGDKEFVEITTGAGVLVVHRGHKLLTKRGWVSAEELGTEDELEARPELIKRHVKYTSQWWLLRLVEDAPNLRVIVSGRIKNGGSTECINYRVVHHIIRGKPVSINDARRLLENDCVEPENVYVSIGKHRPIKAVIRLNRNTGWMIGKIAHRGTLLKAHAMRGEYVLSVHCRTHEEAIRLAKTISEELGVEARVIGNNVIVTGTLAYLFAKWFGWDKGSKSIPLQLLLNGNNEYWEGIVEGVFGDRDTIFTRSRALAETLVILGVLTGKRIKYRRRGINGYRVVLSQASEPFGKIISIRRVHIDSPLYDIEVDGHSYLQGATMAVSHNTSFHAAGPEQALTRLSTEPISVSRQALLQLPVIVYIIPYTEAGKIKRRVQVFFNNTRYIDKYWVVEKVCDGPTCNINKLLSTKALSEVMSLRGMSEHEMMKLYLIMEEILREPVNIVFDETPKYLYTELVNKFAGTLPVKIKIEHYESSTRTIELKGGVINL